MYNNVISHTTNCLLIVKFFWLFKNDDIICTIIRQMIRKKSFNKIGSMQMRTNSSIQI
ncbi:hypothetical protein BD408DRAFT_409337 [Parasitella parasitica]|nr:hypothetical protein BD408DRAFT_409337 [Parasitella parasitica]